MMWGLFRKKRRYLVTCPRCGSHQVEEEGYVSTICSACGYGFAEEEAGRQPFESQNGSNGKSKEEIELVHCYRCGKEHIAQRSSGKTVCPNCGAVISFEDRQIEGRLSEAIDTRGDLIVAPLGNLFSSLAVCRNAEIMGRFAGILICEGRLSLLGSGVFPARIRAQEVVVGGEANVSCPYSL
ncbi:MAG: polymer-forming cytoskeletal protein, partial [Chthoniobacterales bacterium]|nr:polymer-forming cytoskeletal protein [Chthoniobacterales bacterium]